MAKQKVSLADIALAQAAPDRLEIDSSAEPSKAGRPVAVKRPHVSLYLDERVQRQIKQIALDLGKRPHDIYLEGVEHVLMKHIGKSIADIT